MLLRDSITAADIPLAGLDAVAGYGDGRYQWTSEDWARFPEGIVALVIVTNATSRGDVLDVERGAALPGDAPGWADRFDRPHRRRPTIYCSRGLVPEVRQAMGSREWDWWAATLDGTTIVDGAVAVQAFGSDMTGGHYDESVIWDATWLDDPSTGGPMSTDVFTQSDRDMLISVWYFLLRGYDLPPRSAPDGTPPQHDSILLNMSYAREEANQGLERIETAIAKLGLPIIDPVALAAALAAHEDFWRELAAALLDRVVERLKLPPP